VVTRPLPLSSVDVTLFPFVSSLRPGARRRPSTFGVLFD